MNHLLNRTRLLLIGMQFDLRLVSIMSKEWTAWQDEIEKHIDILIKQMAREIGVYTENQSFSRKTEEDDYFIYYHFFSDYGEVVLAFSKTKERIIQFDSIDYELYKEPHSLV